MKKQKPIKTWKKIRSWKNKKVLIRADLDIPFYNGKLILNDESDIRLKSAVSTFRTFIAKKSIPIVLAHVGRPTTNNKKMFDMSLVARRIGYLCNKKTHNISLIDVPLRKRFFSLSTKTKKYINELSDEVFLITSRKIYGKIISYNELKIGDILILQNTRFWKEEEKNDQQFAKALSCFGDFFINDAFATCHREHASTYGVMKFLSSYAGPILEREIKNIDRVLRGFHRPLVCVVGGAKISTKLGVIKRFLSIADHVIVGGGVANTFFSAQGHDIGLSLIEEKAKNEAKKLLKNKKLILPIDVVVSKTNRRIQRGTRTVSVDQVLKDEYIVDIGPKTLSRILPIIVSAGTIIWNGPLGLFEEKNASSGTYSFARAVARSKAFSLVGGGETLMVLSVLGISKKISYISLGGGALLKYVENKGNLKVINRLRG